MREGDFYKKSNYSNGMSLKMFEMINSGTKTDQLLNMRERPTEAEADSAGDEDDTFYPLSITRVPFFLYIPIFILLFVRQPAHSPFSTTPDDRLFLSSSFSR